MMDDKPQKLEVTLPFYLLVSLMQTITEWECDDLEVIAFGIALETLKGFPETQFRITVEEVNE